ncbi:restriction endonuclease type II-like protein [Lipomyces chichibuensis]|uniref:restriction endonuclease type II-like protein n=1 Tax=Lipomyces chichibuensis TaxID=1546026 RepID=UPI003343233F
MDDFSFDDTDLRALERIESQARQTSTAQTQRSPNSRPPPVVSGSSGTVSGTAAVQPSSRSGQSRNPSVQAATLQQPVPRKVANASSSLGSIVVSPRQKGNPVLNYIRNVPWEYGDIVPDYLVDPTIAILFLSLKYHRLHPEYIYNRITKMAKNFRVRILLIVVDIENHEESIKELTKTGVVNNLAIILSWSAQEAGHYISLFGALKSAPPTAIQASQKEDYSIRIVDLLTSIRGVNKNDAASLISTFGSLKNAVNDGGKTISDIGGWGDAKVRRFRVAITEPFVVRRKTTSRLPKSFQQKSGVNKGKQLARPMLSNNAMETPITDTDILISENESLTENGSMAQHSKSQQKDKEEEILPTFSGVMAELAKLRKTHES